MTFSPRRASSREGSLDQYLKEISQYPLIDRAEEARLAKLIRKGEEEALNKLNYTKPLKQVFGERFVSAYQEVKEHEMTQYRKVISSWEREHLLLNV